MICSSLASLSKLIGAAWNSLAESNHNDDVTRGFLINIHHVGQAPPQYCLSDWSIMLDVITYLLSGLDSIHTNFPAVLTKNKAHQVWPLICRSLQEILGQKAKCNHKMHWSYLVSLVFVTEPKENCCKYFKTRKQKVMTSGICLLNQKAVLMGGGFPNIMTIFVTSSTLLFI